MPNLNSYGFVSLADIASQRVAPNMRVVNDAIRLSVEEHNRQVDAALAELTQRTVDPYLRYRVRGGGSLQPLDEWGNPKPVLSAGQYDVAFPIQKAGDAWGNNRFSRALMTVEDVDGFTFDALLRDANWLKRHMLGALLDNTSYTFIDPNDKVGTLTVQPLANGDAASYLRKNGDTSVDNHYYAQAAAIADATNPYPALESELSEHMGNDGPYVAYIPTALKATTMALATFHDVADANLRRGDGQTVLVGNLDRGFGDRVLGYVEPGIWIVEWSMLPATHGIMVARGALTPALAMREYDAPELQGLQTENFSPDGNLYEYRFIRAAGFGALNRTAALAFQIGNAAYQIPAGYATPMPA